MKNIKKLLAITLVVAAVMTVVLPSVAETYSTKYITASSGSTVNLRKTATKNLILLQEYPSILKYKPLILTPNGVR